MLWMGGVDNRVEYCLSARVCVRVRARACTDVIFATLSLRCSSEGAHSLLSALVGGRVGELGGGGASHWKQKHTEFSLRVTDSSFIVARRFVARADERRSLVI